MNIRKKMIVAVMTTASATAVMGFVPDTPVADNTAAWYPFTEYAAGTEWVSSTPEKSGSTGRENVNREIYNAITQEQQLITTVTGTGKVQVSDDVPGTYLFASQAAQVPMSQSWQSLVVPQVDGDNYSYLSIGTLPYSTMADADAFTIEFFFKVQENWTTPGYLLWWDFGQGDANRIFVHAPADGNNPKAIRAYCSFTPPDETEKIAAKDNQIWKNTTRNFNDGTWHHLALVYYGKSAGEKVGKARLILDYELVAGEMLLPRFSDYGLDKSKLQQQLRFGDGRWGGAIAGLRVTQRALSVGELLRTGSSPEGPDRHETIAFYPLDDQPAGTEFTDAMASKGDPVRPYWNGYYFNQAKTLGYRSTGYGVSLGTKVSTSGATPSVEYSSVSDVPGAYLYDGLRKTAPLKTLSSSLQALGSGTRPAGSPNVSNWMLFERLAGDLATQDAYTVEFFAKFESEAKLFLFYDQGVMEQNRITLQRNNSSGKLVLGYTGGSNVQVAYPDNKTSLADGLWHHFALVFRADEIGAASGLLSLYCDYTLVSSSLAVTRNAAQVQDTFRLSEGNQKVRFSSVRVTAAALTPQEFLYASDRADGVLANANWNWRLEGAAGAVVDSATTVGTALDADQYLFKDMHGFVGTAASGGSLLYELPFMRGKRLIGGVADGRNLTAAATAGSHLASGLTGPLCAPGLVFTVEALAKGTAPANGAATVFGAESPAGTSVWNLALDASGALQLNYTLQDGTPVSAKVMDGFAGDAHHVALVADILNRLFKVYVDSAEKLSVTAAKPLATDGLRFVAAGGCGQAVLTGSIDEIRLTHALLEPSAFEKVERQGLVLVVE